VPTGGHWGGAWGAWALAGKQDYYAAAQRHRAHVGAPQAVGAGKGRGRTKPPLRRHRRSSR
jgi:hypothetical protein